MNKLAYSIRVATLADAADVAKITNEAFMADAFFKKPEYIQRFCEEGVAEMISNPKEHGVFLIASDNGGNNTIGTLHFEGVKEVLDGSSSKKMLGSFSAVSVPERFARRGVGAFLVRNAEDYLSDSVLRGYSGDHTSTEVWMEMGVVSVREDLFPWYQKLGYEIVDEKITDPSFNRIVKEGLNVFLVKMRKRINIAR